MNTNNHLKSMNIPKMGVIIFTLVALLGCSNSNNMESNIVEEKAFNISSIQGVWILRKGGGNNTEYSIKNEAGKLILITKASSPAMDSPVTLKSELIQVDDKFVRKEESEKPQYYFQVKNETLTIYDSFGIYADLKKEN